MRLLFIHGAPATGKLTIAKALLRIVDGRLFDNHAAIDFARTMFDFGTPEFWSLVHNVRISDLDAASKNGIPLVVMTYCYSEPEGRPTFEEFDTLMQRHDGALLPVFLSCAEDEIARRIGNADRRERRKVSTMEGLTKFRAIYHDSPVPKANCLMMETSTRSAEITAQDIAGHFGLKT